MLSKSELLNHPNYLLTTYQLEIYKQLSNYMSEHNLKKKDIAKKLDVSNSYVSQVLNGDFNFTLKKLIELGLTINKVPYLEFVTYDEYWRREKEGTVIKEVITKETFITVDSTVSFDDPTEYFDFPKLDLKGGRLPKSVSTTIKSENI